MHVYDRHDRAGGLLTYGIPGFKLEKQVVMRRVERLEDGGIIFHDELRGRPRRDASTSCAQRHDAVLIATGVYKARAIKAPGVGSAGVVEALDYLTASNRKGFGDAVPAFDDGSLDAAGKHVVVIGGGDTAMDCVRTAIRQGATSVKCLYRRDRANMPGSQREVANAEEEGVEFVWLSAPAGVRGAATASPASRATRMRLGAPDASGRRAPEPDPGSGFTLPGRSGDQGAGLRSPRNCRRLFGAPELGVTRWGTVLRRQQDDDDQRSTACSPPATSCAARAWWCGRSATAAMSREQMHEWLKAKAKAAKESGVSVIALASCACAHA